jgi:hypothetical protein
MHKFPQDVGNPVKPGDLVRITMPFHPFFGKQFPLLQVHKTRRGDQLQLQVEGESFYLVPIHWTDMATPDPEIVIGRGRAIMRSIDLINLAKIVDELMAKEK